MKSKTVELCPMCKKETLQPFVGFEAGFQFRCGNCGYVGPLRLLVDKP